MKKVEKVREDDSYPRRWLYLLLIATVIVVLLVLTAVTTIPYIVKYVPKPVNSPYTVSMIKEDTTLVDDSLILTKENKQYDIKETLTLSTDMKNVTIGSYENPKYLYHGAKDGDKCSYFFTFSIESEKYTLQSVTFTIDLCYGDGTVVMTLEKNDYTSGKLKDNTFDASYKDELTNHHIKKVTVYYSIL